MRGLAVCCGSTVSRDITIGGCNSCIFQVNTRTRTVRLSRQVDVVGGRQRGIADFRAGHCRIQRKVARGDVGVFNLNTGPLHSDVIRGIQRGSACSVCKVDGIPTRTFPGKSNVTGRQRVVAFKVDGIPTRTAPDKSNVIRGIQRGSACKVDGIPTRTAPDKSNVIRGIQRGSACKVDGIPTHTVPGKSNVTGRQRVVASKQNPGGATAPVPGQLDAAI